MNIKKKIKIIFQRKMLTRKVSCVIIRTTIRKVSKIFRKRGEKMLTKTIPRSKLIKLRKEKGFTQEQMARLLKIKRATYANYETGYRTPNLKSIIEMKKILGTTDDKIFLQDNDTKSI